jgi:hypothetical protein
MAHLAETEEALGQHHGVVAVHAVLQRLPVVRAAVADDATSRLGDHGTHHQGGGRGLITERCSALTCATTAPGLRKVGPSVRQCLAWRSGGGGWWLLLIVAMPSGLRTPST